MSRFYISGKNERPKGNFKKGGRSELTAHIRGWNLGIEIEAKVHNGLDTFEIYKTNGTNGTVRTHVTTFVDSFSKGARNPKGQLK